MKCPEAALLVDLLYEELENGERSRLLAHIEGCGECRDRCSDLQALAAAADRWVAPPPPHGIAERALARVASERLREAAPRWAAVSSAEVLRSVGLGAGAAVLSLLLVVGVSWQQVTPVTVGIVGVVWTALYVGTLLMRSHARLWRLAEPALAGAGVMLILAPPLSIPAVVELCARWVQAGPESVSFALVLMLLAAGYTAGPLLIGGLMFDRPVRGAWAADGAKLSLLYALLIAPAVYLQCLPLPLGVTAIWMSGAVLGAALAGPASLHLARFRMKPA